MSLYIRVQTAFWSHRKTLRLRALIGDSAFWVPVRLWSYAAENQPDGDFSDYTEKEVAMLIGYNGDAKAMLDALRKASFMDGMKLHDWEEHNGYHSAFRERAKIAANARWSKRDPSSRPPPGKDKKGIEASIASGMLVAPESENFKKYWLSFPRNLGKRSLAWKLWNELGCEEIADLVIDSVKAHSLDISWTRDSGRFIPGGDTFLRERKWENKLSLPKPSQSSSSVGTGIYAPGGDMDPAVTEKLLQERYAKDAAKRGVAL